MSLRRTPLFVRTVVARALGVAAAVVLLSGALVVSGMGPAAADPVTSLFVATTGSDSANTCTVSTSPCQTIEHAVTAAEGVTGSVAIEVSSGTYAEQVTVPPVDFTGSFAPSSLNIEANPSNTDPVNIQPTALTTNLPTVPNSGQFFDDFGGAHADAIIGVGQPGTNGLYQGFTTNVTISGLNLSGQSFTEPTTSAPIAGIFFVNVSGTITGDAIHDMNPDTTEQSITADHAIDVRGVNPLGAATPSYSVAVTANVLGDGSSDTDWVGHVAVDLMSTGRATSSVAGSLGATVEDNDIAGTIQGPTSLASQNLVAAGGLTSLTTSGNTIQNSQAPGFGGGMNLTMMAPDAPCIVSGNQVLADDYGIQVEGANGCVLSGNTIDTGFYGISANATPAAAPNDADAPSPNTTITDNTITGTATFLTSSSATAPADQPLDGINVADGPDTSITGNSISGYVNDVYDGVDPVRFDNTATWPSGVPATISGNSTSTWSTAGTAVTHNVLGPLATPAANDVTNDGVACLNTPPGGGCGPSSPLGAEANWWSTPSGPGPVGPGSGPGVSADVDFANWCTTASCPSVPSPPLNAAASVSPSAGTTSVTWSAPATDGGSPLTTYTVTPHDLTTGNPGTAVGSATAPVTISGLAVGDLYDFTVTATNTVGQGPAATSNQVVPLASVPGASSASGTSNSPTGTATGSVGSPNAPGSISATGAGSGTITVTAYGSANPITSISAGGSFYDVKAAPGSNFSAITFTVCGVALGQRVMWWNAAAVPPAYQPVSNQSASTGSASCVTVTVNSSTSPNLSQLTGTVFLVPSALSKGYWEVASDGGIFSFGSARFFGSMGGTPLNKPIVGIAAAPDGKGYWEVASDGGIFSFGSAQFFGSMGGTPLNKPIVGIAAAPDGKGYWEVASDGGIFSFGSAQFFGSMGGTPLNKPIVGIAAAPDGKGYWEVASDGGIFSFGSAQFFGSMGGTPLNKPIVGIAAAPDGKGYWEVASDGGIFSFGSAQFFGSMGGTPLNKPIVGIAAAPDGKGYWEVASDGGIFSFGSAQFFGSMGGTPLNQPIVGIAT